MSKYNKNIVKHICELVSRDEYTVSEICSIVGIGESTWFDWMKLKPEFSESVQKAKDKLVEKRLAECKKSLYKMITGYEVKESVTEYVNVNGKPTPKSIRETTKHVLPSLGAIIHYQTNMDPEHWANKQRTEITGKDGAPITTQLPKLSEEDIEELRKMNGLQ